MLDYDFERNDEASFSRLVKEDRRCVNYTLEKEQEELSMNSIATFSKPLRLETFLGTRVETWWRCSIYRGVLQTLEFEFVWFP